MRFRQSLEREGHKEYSNRDDVGRWGDFSLFPNEQTQIFSHLNPVVFPKLVLGGIGRLVANGAHGGRS